MNAPLRRAGVVVLVLFGLLFANLNWVQAYKAEEYRNSDYNPRVQIAEYDRQRGNIEVGAVSQAVATSKATDGELKYLRSYPLKDQYAHVLGFKPVNGAAAGIEKSENDYLSGQSDELFTERIRDLFTGDETPGGNVLLSLGPKAQKAAYDALKANKMGVDKGAAIALDPKTGAIQALVSMPSFDPNPLVSHNSKSAEAAYKQLEADKDGPLKNRALSETYPPGSTFKVIDSAAALENGLTIQTNIPAGPSYTAPTSGNAITNAAPSICPEPEVSLIEALTESCNTGFAQLGVKLGGQVIKDKARAFGFEDEGLVCGNLEKNTGLPVAASRTGDIQNPDGGDDKAALAQSAIGQNNVRMTPIQGALIAAAVANDGSQMRPYLVQRLLGPDRTSTHYTANPKELRRPVSSQVAGDLQEMMFSVAENGTARSARINGYDVGGKTGTAQTGVSENHGWFIGFVLKDGQPLSAVAVFLEAAGDGGSAEAARIGGLIMRAAIADRGGN